MRRTWVHTITDPHCNYIYGLMRPGIMLEPLTDLEDYFIPSSTQTQQMLYEFLTEDIDRLKKFAGKKDEIVLVIVGDICQGNHGLSWLVSPRHGDEIMIAADILEHFMKLPTLSTIRLVKGTKFHSGKGGDAEVRVVNRLKNKKTKIDIAAYYHMDLTINGVRFDISHHGPTTGARKWLKGNELRWYIRDRMIDEIMDGRKPPDCILRGHFHERSIVHHHEHTESDTYDTWGAIVPAYSISNDDYTKKVTKSKGKMTVGPLLWEIIDGKIVKCHDWTRTIDIRRKEVIS